LLYAVLNTTFTIGAILWVQPSLGLAYAQKFVPFSNGSPEIARVPVEITIHKQRETRKGRYFTHNEKNAHGYYQ